MTSLQKTILEWLIEGGSISGNQKYGYRLKDSAGNPLAKFSYRTFYTLKDHLRFEKGHYRLNKKYVRSLNKRYWIKKLYLQYLNKQKLSQQETRP
ncbi:MAG: hypothetical protein BGN92_09060 [Sphingobacteriales bacterium 41-5]|nr:MAG: hypothetical protein BGN92_09060 [Sphingobacteriales bacterium 41-5]